MYENWNFYEKKINPEKRGLSYHREYQQPHPWSPFNQKTLHTILKYIKKPGNVQYSYFSEEEVTYFQL